MDNVRVHAITGSMVSEIKGINKLIEVYRNRKEEREIYVISSVFDPDKRLSTLLDSAKENFIEADERLSRMAEAWLESATVTLKNPENVLKSLKEGFLTCHDILKAVSIVKDSNSRTFSYLENLTSTFISIILVEKFKEEGIESKVVNYQDLLSLDNLDSYPPLIFVSGEKRECIIDSDASGKIKKGEEDSEYTASLIASHFMCPLTMWNDRSLLYTASPKDVPSSLVLRNLTYAEATELSFFGAPILHPHAYIPVEDKALPLSLRYWGDIAEEGTLITSSDISSSSSVKAFSVVNNIALINVEGSGMSGVPGVSSRLFASLRDKGISVIFISQASSEYSICFALPVKEEKEALKTIRKEFEKELESHAISSISSERDLSILAVVGEKMNGSIGIAGAFFSSLARSGVNVRAIAQGSSERNISAVIPSKDAVKAERALHSVFFMSQQTLSLGLFGPGNIGGTLLDQIGRERERLKKDFDLDIRVRGIARSERMLLSEKGIDLSSWREDFEKNSIPYNEEVFLNHIKAQYYPHWVLVDCTASNERAMQYASFISKGFHVITPNKKASSGPYEYFEELKEVSKKTGKKFFYETTVGAGLPIITTLKDLRETGDIIEKVEGMVSGTLSWLFSNYDGTRPFSSLIKEAKEKGYTEPDPRDDLSGMDVGRKTVILARELGYKTEVKDLEIENLVPEELRGVTKEEFLEKCSLMDDKMLALFTKAKERGNTLRYVGRVENGECKVELAEFPLSHPFSQAKGTDNVIEFTTLRYHNQPLVVQGPGAGPEVTAAGIFADLLRLSAYLGSKI